MSNPIFLSIEENNSNQKIEIDDDISDDIVIGEHADLTSVQLHYSYNYTKKELSRIAGYYDIKIGRKRKDELIMDIVLFELDIDNISIVYQRKKLWNYMRELEEDSYLSKFIIFN